MSGPPNYWTEQQTRHNILEKYTADQINGTKFDPQSIMLYFFPPSWTTNGVGTEQNEELSVVDKAYIRSPAMYPGLAAPVPVRLVVDARRSVVGEIGRPGEEDAYEFTVLVGGKYLVQTKGQTNVYMKLFGPDSWTALIAEDDDGGESGNAKISANLTPGTYYVQIRHQTGSGTGQYSIHVSRPRRVVIRKASK